MKNLFQFLAEAGTSRAAEQAAKLNLKSDGHGGWIDSRGSVVATTEKGKLVFLKKKQPQNVDPVQKMERKRAADELAGAPLQRNQRKRRQKQVKKKEKVVEVQKEKH